MLLAIKPAWVFIKKYWKILVAVVAAIVGFVLFRKRITTFVDDYNKINEIHEKEIKAIEVARSEEKTQREQNKKVLEKTLIAVEKQFNEEQLSLDRRKQKEIKRVIDKHGSDPVALADELTKVTGFRIILPRD